MIFVCFLRFDKVTHRETSFFVAVEQPRLFMSVTVTYLRELEQQPWTLDPEFPVVGCLAPCPWLLILFHEAGQSRAAHLFCLAWASPVWKDDFEFIFFFLSNNVVRIHEPPLQESMAISLAWPGEKRTLQSLGNPEGPITHVFVWNHTFTLTRERQI